jgi:hypothetical protein
MTDVKKNMDNLNDQSINALMALNEINYNMQPEIGISKNITHQSDLFQNSFYTGGEAICIAQTGSAFVDPYESYLTFKVIGTATSNFGVGSMCNLIEEILIESRTGVDIARLREAALFLKNRDDWEHDANWKATEGIAKGYPLKIDYGETVANTQPTANIKTFTCRLSDLCGVFRPINCKLLPPMMMEGLRIRLVLNTANRALVDSGTNAKSYTVYPSITWKVVELNDLFRRKIQEIAASRGLVVMYTEIHQQQRNVIGTAVNFEVNKAASKALKSYVIPRLASNIGTQLANKDSMSSSEFLFVKAQSRIGNSYFPQKSLETLSVGDFYEFYAYSLFSACNNNRNNIVVQPLSTAGGYGSTSSLNSKAAFITSYNRSSVTDLDGYIINNSRSLLFDFEVSPADPAVSYRYDTYLEYLRVAIIFTSNMDVKD